MKEPLISILMPTFNDSDTITESIESVIKQNYANWELIIINDLFDKTDNIIEKFADSRIKYFHNTDSIGQLNALLNGISSISGDYVTILHSDDLLFSQSSLMNCIRHFQDTTLDGIYSDLIVINEKGDETGIFKTAPYVNTKTLANIFLLRGSNIISDFFFVSKKVFFEVIVNNYVLWNMPYWFHEKRNLFGAKERNEVQFDSKIINGFQILCIKKVKPWYKYRIYLNNYILSDVGKFEAFNGMLRTTLTLSNYFDEYSFSRVPFFTEYLIKKWGLSLTLSRPFSGSYKELVYSIYHSVYGKECDIENVYIKSILNFYRKSPSLNEIFIPEKLIRNCCWWYKGCDARRFYLSIISKNDLDPLYEYILKYANEGFRKIFISNPQDLDRMCELLKFLNIIALVEITNTNEQSE